MCVGLLIQKSVNEGKKKRFIKIGSNVKLSSKENFKTLPT